MSVSNVWCACGREIPKLRAAWGETKCRACDKQETPPAHDGPPVPLEDIDDVVGYVTEYVWRRFSQLPPQMKEDYIAEGVAIAFRLHRDSWRREQTPSFRLYLSTYLWNRLRDYWRSEQCRSGEAHWANKRVVWTGRDSLDAMSDAGTELAAPDVEGLAA